MRNLRFVLLLLASAGPILAHEPHKPAAPAGPGAAAIALPEGWVESRPPSAAGAMAPALAADGSGFLATWIEPAVAGGKGAQRVRLARWQDGAWGAATTVRASPSLFANWADVPGVMRAADGALYAWWLERSSAGTYTYDVRLARSTDGGMTFAPLGVLHDDRSPAEHGFVSAVRAGKGVRFYYLDGRATPGDQPMQLRTVFVEGAEIAASELVDASVCDCCATAAVALPAGASVVAYRDRTAGEIRDVQVAARTAAGVFTTHSVGNDAWKIAGCPVNGPALAANGGQLAVAWFAAPGDRPRMAVALSADGGATWGAPRPIAAAAGGTPMGQLALAPLDGGFALSWLEAIAGGSELRLARLDAGGNAAPSLAIARTGAGRTAGIPRLASAGKRLALLWVESAHPAGTGLRFATQSP
jgi:hypothetical protein